MEVQPETTGSCRLSWFVCNILQACRVDVSIHSSFQIETSQGRDVLPYLEASRFPSRSWPSGDVPPAVPGHLGVLQETRGLLLDCRGDRLGSG